MLSSFFHFLWLLPRRMVIKLIDFYQSFLSPDHSDWGKQRFAYGYCKYTPTCSQYTKEAITKKGLLLGSFKGLWRILRCNPCSKGGVDLPH